MSTNEQQKVAYWKSHGSVEHKARNMYKAAKDRARSRNVFFDITQQDIVDVWPEDSVCPVLGLPLVLTHKIQHDDSPSLDRIDNNRGYEVGNIAVVSLKANRVKNNATLEELKAIVDWMEGL